MQAVGAMGDGQEKLSGIFVGSKRTKKEGWKVPILAAVGSTADIFLYPPQDLEAADLEGSTFLTLPDF